jgi:general secretion pathway protein N
MTAPSWIFGIAAAAILSLALGDLSRAANPTIIDPRDDTDSGISNPPSFGLGTGAAPPAPTGNPLWAIPLNSLTATRERPLFVPSRRPPAPAVTTAAPPQNLPPPKPVALPEPEAPPLALVGVVSGTDDGLAVFLNTSTRDIVRLKTGEGHEGWILRSVKGREAVLEKNRRNVVIEMPPPSGDRK